MNAGFHLGMAVVLFLALATVREETKADQPPSTPVPAYWVSYAQLVSNQLAAWLDDGGDQAAMNLRKYFEQPAAGQPTSDVVRVWITPDGHIARVTFNSLGNPQADDDLRQILTQKQIGEPPPADMPQPLVLRLRLKTKP